MQYVACHVNTAENKQKTKKEKKRKQEGEMRHFDSDSVNDSFFLLPPSRSS